jgi:hypothetical protein
MDESDFTVIEYPASRQFIIDAGTTKHLSLLFFATRTIPNPGVTGEKCLPKILEDRGLND